MINHLRIWYGTGLAIASGVKEDDVLYTTLPLYHSAALMVGLHGCIVSGKLFSQQGVGAQDPFTCAHKEK